MCIRDRYDTFIDIREKVEHEIERMQKSALVLSTLDLALIHISPQIPSPQHIFALLQQEYDVESSL